MEYEDYTEMVAGIVRFYSVKYNASAEDLLQDSYLIYHDAVESYDESLSSFKHWFRKNLKQKLFNIVKKRWDFDPLSSDCETYLPDNSSLVDPVTLLEFKQILESLSDSAKEIVSIIFNDARSIQPSDMQWRKRRIKSNLMELLKSRGWTGYCIRYTFQEIKQSL